MLAFVSILLLFVGNRMRNSMLYIPYLIIALIYVFAMIAFFVLSILAMTGNRVDTPTVREPSVQRHIDSYFDRAGSGATLGSTIILGLMTLWQLLFFNAVWRDYKSVKHEPRNSAI